MGRVAATNPPGFAEGVGMTIRKFSQQRFPFQDLVGFGSMPDWVADIIAKGVSGGKRCW